METVEACLARKKEELDLLNSFLALFVGVRAKGHRCVVQDVCHILRIQQQELRPTGNGEQNRSRPMLSAQPLHGFDCSAVEAQPLRGRDHCRTPNENSLAEGRQHNAAEDAKRIDQACARAPRQASPASGSSPICQPQTSVSTNFTGRSRFPIHRLAPDCGLAQATAKPSLQEKAI
jgi:hypothetical protein